MPRMTEAERNTPEFLHRQVPKDAAMTAFHKGLADATEI